MSDFYQIRPVKKEDIPAVLRLRRLMFEEMGCGDPCDLDASDAACAAYFGRAIPTGKYRGWVAVTPTGEAVASGGIVVDRHPPGPANPDGQVAYIMNMSTDPAHRRRGLAHRIFEEIMAWVCSERIHMASLHATADGRSLYEQFGFSDGNKTSAGLLTMDWRDSTSHCAR